MSQKEKSMRKLSECLGNAFRHLSNLLSNEVFSSQSETAGYDLNHKDFAWTVQELALLSRMRDHCWVVQPRKLGLPRRLNTIERTHGSDKKENKGRWYEGAWVCSCECWKTDSDWAISEEILLTRGLIELTTCNKEHEIRQKIGNAIRQHYVLTGDNNFSIFESYRRKLTVSSCEL